MTSRAARIQGQRRRDIRNDAAVCCGSRPRRSGKFWKNLRIDKAGDLASFAGSAGFSLFFLNAMAARTR